METNIEQKLIDSQAIAKRYGVSTRTVSNWISEKRIPFIKLSERMVRFDPLEVDAALARNHRVAAVGETGFNSTQEVHTA